MPFDPTDLILFGISFAIGAFILYGMAKAGMNMIASDNEYVIFALVIVPLLLGSPFYIIAHVTGINQSIRNVVYEERYQRWQVARDEYNARREAERAAAAEARRRIQADRAAQIERDHPVRTWVGDQVRGLVVDQWHRRNE